MNDKQKGIIIVFSVCIISIGLAVYSRYFYKAPYPYVYCNNQYFYVAGGYIKEAQLDTLITEVKNNTEKKKHNENGDSNVLEIEARVYKMKDAPNYESIAVENDGYFSIAYPIVEKE